MPLKDAPQINRDELSKLPTGELLVMLQNLENKAYHNRQLFEFACKSHVEDFRDVELELTRAGIPEDDGYGCYAIAQRVRMLAEKVKHERANTETPIHHVDKGL